MSVLAGCGTWVCRVHLALLGKPQTLERRWECVELSVSGPTGVLQALPWLPPCSVLCQLSGNPA